MDHLPRDLAGELHRRLVRLEVPVDTRGAATLWRGRDLETGTAVAALELPHADLRRAYLRSWVERVGTFDRAHLCPVRDALVADGKLVLFFLPWSSMAMLPLEGLGPQALRATAAQLSVALEALHRAGLGLGPMIAGRVLLDGADPGAPGLRLVPLPDPQNPTHGAPPVAADLQALVRFLGILAGHDQPAALAASLLDGLDARAGLRREDLAALLADCLAESPSARPRAVAPLRMSLCRLAEADEAPPPPSAPPEAQDLRPLSAALPIPSSGEAFDPAEPILWRKGTVIGGRYRIDSIVTHEAAVGCEATDLAAPDQARVRVRRLAIPATDLLDVLARRWILPQVSLDHPGLLPILDFGWEPGALILVDALTDAEPIEARLLHGPLEQGRVLALATGLCSALSALHERELLHLDLRPSTVLVLPGGAPLLADAGVAGLYAGRPPGAQVERHADLRYRAPELLGLLHAEPGPESDLYGLAAVLYELITGTSVYAGLTLDELRAAKVSAPPDPRPLVETGFPPAVAALILRALSPVPEDRPRSAAMLARQIDAAARGAPPVPDGPPLRLDAPIPLVGRSVEERRLKIAIAEARQGRGSAFIFAGPPGVGRTSLLDLADREAHRAGMPVIRHDARPADHGVPFSAVASLLAGVHRLVAALPHDLRAAVDRELAGELGAGVAVLARHAPDLARRLGAAPPLVQVKADASDQAVVLARALAATARACGALVILIDDLHWLDEASGSVLEALAPALRASAIVLLCGARSSADSRVGSAAAEVLLDQGAVLSARDGLDGALVGRIIERRLGISPPALFVRRCAALSNGLPGPVVAVLEEAVRAGVITRMADGWEAHEERIAVLRGPPGPAAWAEFQIRALSPSCQSVAAAASVWGIPFAPGEIASLLPDLGGPTLHRVLAEALRAGVMTVTPEGKLDFRTGSLRLASGLLRAPEERGALHTRAAALCSRAQASGEGIHRAAEHAVRAGGGAEAIPILTASAGRLARLGCSAQAVRFVREALARVPSENNRERIRLQALLARAHLAGGDLDRAAQLARAVVTAGEGDPTIFSIWLDVVEGLVERGETPEALHVLADLLPHLGEEIPPAGSRDLFLRWSFAAKGCPAEAPGAPDPELRLRLRARLLWSRATEERKAKPVIRVLHGVLKLAARSGDASLLSEMTPEVAKILAGGGCGSIAVRVAGGEASHWSPARDLPYGHLQPLWREGRVRAIAEELHLGEQRIVVPGARAQRRQWARLWAARVAVAIGANDLARQLLGRAGRVHNAPGRCRRAALNVLLVGRGGSVAQMAEAVRLFLEEITLPWTGTWIVADTLPEVFDAALSSAEQIGHGPAARSACSDLLTVAQRVQGFPEAQPWLDLLIARAQLLEDRSRSSPRRLQRMLARGDLLARAGSVRMAEILAWAARSPGMGSTRDRRRNLERAWSSLQGADLALLLKRRVAGFLGRHSVGTGAAQAVSALLQELL